MHNEFDRKSEFWAHFVLPDQRNKNKRTSTGMADVLLHQQSLFRVSEEDAVVSSFKIVKVLQDVMPRNSTNGLTFTRGMTGSQVYWESDMYFDDDENSRKSCMITMKRSSKPRGRVESGCPGFTRRHGRDWNFSLCSHRGGVARQLPYNSSQWAFDPKQEYSGYHLVASIK